MCTSSGGGTLGGSGRWSWCPRSIVVRTALTWISLTPCSEVPALANIETSILPHWGLMVLCCCSVSMQIASFASIAVNGHTKLLHSLLKPVAGTICEPWDFLFQHWTGFVPSIWWKLELKLSLGIWVVHKQVQLTSSYNVQIRHEPESVKRHVFPGPWKQISLRLLFLHVNFRLVSRDKMDLIKILPAFRVYFRILHSSNPDEWQENWVNNVGCWKGGLRARKFINITSKSCIIPHRYLPKSLRSCLKNHVITGVLQGLQGRANSDILLNLCIRTSKCQCSSL